MSYDTYTYTLQTKARAKLLLCCNLVNTLPYSQAQVPATEESINALVLAILRDYLVVLQPCAAQTS